MNINPKAMTTKSTLIACLFMLNNASIAQEPVEVTDQVLKVGGMMEETMYYGFAAGDRIVFSFSEAGGKELKEVEIVEYPSNSRFSDFKTKSVENRTIQVQRSAVYMFRFKNSALSGRVCRIKIMRIPEGETTKHFNTTVAWQTRQDTTWNTYTKDVIVGYDTVNIQRSRKQLVKVDTLFTPLFDKQLRVHSETAIGKTQYTYATVELPVNKYLPNQILPYESTEVINWSYWLGVGQKAEEEYKKANENLASGIVSLGSMISGYGALAQLAATGISMFGTSTVGDNVRFRFYGVTSGQEVTIDHGNVVSASGRNDRVTQGSFSVELFNDNFRDGIDVNLRMVVMQVRKTWQDIPYTEQKVTPRTEKQLFRDPVITTRQVPVTGM